MKHAINDEVILATLFLIFAFAIAVGAFTRPLAVLMAVYTLGTSLIEHRYWTTTGAHQLATMEAFYKNLSLIGGFLLLCITDAGKVVKSGCSEPMAQHKPGTREVLQRGRRKRVDPHGRAYVQTVGEPV